MKLVWRLFVGAGRLENAAQLTGVSASVGWKFTGALPPHLLSCMNMVGGVGDADSSIFPSFETDTTFGGDGCGCCDGSISAVGMS